MKDRVRIVLIGDPQVGKTSLIQSLSEEKFPAKVPECVGVKEFGPSVTPDHVKLEIVDTRSFDSSPTASDAELLKKRSTEAEIKLAHAILLVYDVENPQSFDRIESFWLPWLRTLDVPKTPILLVGNKIDVRGDTLTQSRLESQIIPLMSKFREIETCVECSAKTLLNVADVFRYAQMNVVHPSKPIYDTDMHELRVECQEALKRIFRIVDRDRDGYLNDHELNQFQKYCFDEPLADEELEGVKSVVAHNVPDGVTKAGMTEAGFVFLHTLFVQRGRMETTWTVLRKYGYDDEQPRLMFHPDYLLPPQYASLGNASVELSPDALYYLRDLFDAHAKRNGTTALNMSALDALFSVAPNGNPFAPSLLQSAVKTTKDGLITRDGFLSMWNLMTLDDYTKSLRYLAYLGFDGRATPTLKVLKSRRKRNTRNTVNALLVGAAGVGKTTLLTRLLEKENPAGGVIAKFRRAAALIPGQSDKFLVLTEVPADEARTILDNDKHKEVINADVVVLLYDSTSVASLSFVEDCARSLTNAPLPVMFVATKGDLAPAEGIRERASKFTRDISVAEPVVVTDKQLNAEFFGKIQAVFENSDGHMIMSSERRSQHRRTKFVRGAVTASVVTGLLAGAAVFGAWLWKQYKARKPE